MKGPVYGQNSIELLASYDPDSSSLKMWQDLSLFGPDWIESSVTLPQSGMMRNGKLYRQTTLVPHTSERESGLLPAPRAQTIHNRMDRLTPKGRMSKDGSQRFGLNLEDYVRLWPTSTTLGTNAPTVKNTPQNQAGNGKMENAPIVGLPWPTPRTRGLMGGSGSREMLKGKVKAGELSEQEATEIGGVKMWATPRAVMTGAPTPERLKDKFRNLEKAVAEEMYPTPQARDFRTGEGHRWQTPEKRSRNLNDKVAFEEGHKLLPTPTANEDAAGTPNGKMQKMLGNHPDVRNGGPGTLNANFVEWLMNFPKDWTKLA